MDESIVNFSTAFICRICERGEELVLLNERTNKSIVKKLRACADVNFEFDDPLPKYICKECYSSLEFAYKFKIQCEYTDRKLRDCLSKQPIKQEIQSIEISPVSDKYYTRIDETENLMDVYSETDGMDESTVNADEYLEELEEQSENSFDLEDMDSISNDAERNFSNSQRIDEEEHIESSCEAETTTPKALTSPEDSSEAKVRKHPSRSKSNAERSARNKQKPDKKEFKCDTCEEVFTIFSEFNSHKKTHGQFRYQCKMCQKWFSKRYYLRTHEKLHMGFKSYKCEICDKVYTNQGNLDRHIRVTHKNDRRYKCNECDKAFSQLTILRQHQAVHITERKFSCDICPKAFKTSEHLALHTARHQPKTERTKATRYRPKKKKYKPPFKLCVCTECGKTSTNMTLHLSHMRTHSGERPYECKICNKRFSFKQSLRNHAYVHTGEKPYKCDECDMAFRQIGHLKGHKLIHSGKKEHVCKTCGKSFALRGNLTVHTRLHTGETPYHCPYCTKKFYDSNGLRRHRALHERRNDRFDFTNKHAMESSQFDSQELRNNSDENQYNLFNQLIDGDMPDPSTTSILVDRDNDVIVTVNEENELLQCIQVILPEE